MTVADATPDFEQVDRSDRAFLGHPKGLGYLGFTEACERFSYYSMQTLLMLYMVKYLLVPGRMEHVVGLDWHQAHSMRLSGAAARLGDFRHLHGLVYLTPIFGGIIADRWLGRNMTLFIGGVLMAIGHFLMAVQPAFLFALLALFSESAISKAISPVRSALSMGPTIYAGRWPSRSSTSSSMSA